MKKQTFHILCFERRARNGRDVLVRVEIPGYPVEIEGLRFFTHRSHWTDAWRVSSVDCGCMLSVMPTIKQAIADAKREIDKRGLAKMKREIRTMAPLFRRARIVSSESWKLFQAGKIERAE